jgi:epoxyqueuosine reductase
VVADDNALVDREAAYRAGLGWYGKSANILLPGKGSWFVLGSVVTDAPLVPADHPVQDGCGSCRRCIDACPTGAIVASGVVDARRCLAWLVQSPGVFPREARLALGNRLYGCDECQEVCPPNIGADRRAAAADDAPAPARGVDVLELLAASDEALLERHGRWYIPDREVRYLRRNALIVLGNTADGSDPEVEQTLRTYLGVDDDLLRAHACWACSQLGRADLLALVADDPSPLVRAEL